MHSLPYFPSPFPDELFYSVCARYHSDSLNQSCQQTMVDIFGLNYINAAVDFPSRLNAIIERLSPQTTMSAQRFILCNTLLPLYLPFIPRERSERAMLQMADPDMRLNVSLILGQCGREIPLIKYLRYCPLCAEENIQEYEEPYWHRSHQVPGIVCCHRHNEWLRESHVKVGPNSPKHSMLSVERALAAPRQVMAGNDRDAGHHRWLAQAVHWLLNKAGSDTHAIPGILRQRYILDLQQRGFLPSKNLAAQCLLDAFLSYYGEEFLESMHCGLNRGSRHNWLFSMFRQVRFTSHPLHHLLVIRFLGMEVWDAVKAYQPDQHPFGEGPWACQNPAAQHFGQRVVSEICISRNTEKQTLVGTFSCECGFVYQSSGVGNPLGQTCCDRIVETGPVWDKRLLEMLENGFSFRKAGRELGIPLNQVIRHAGRLITCITGNRKLDQFYLAREQKRHTWLNLCAENPGKNITGIAAQNTSIYVWLGNYDRPWLSVNSPAPQKGNPEGHVKDWPGEDRELAHKISAAAEAVAARGSQVTFSSIAKELGIVATLFAHRDKLPESIAQIDSYIESDEKYALRRIGDVIAEMCKEGETITRWQVLKRAGVSSIMALRIEGEVITIIAENGDPMFEFVYPAGT